MAWSRPPTGSASGWSCLLLLALLGMASPVGAKTYCCNDDNGRRLCGDILPSLCAKRSYQEYNSQGVMYRQHEAPLTAEQRAQRELELARKKEADNLAAEEDRRNRALLASYTTVADIDAKRARTVAESIKRLQEMQSRYDAALVQKQALAKEAEFFQKRPMPPALKSSVRENDSELNHLKSDIEAKKQEIAEVQARFDDEKRRFLKLRGAATQGTTPAAAPNKPR